MPIYKKEEAVSTRLKHIHVPVGPSISIPPASLLQRFIKRLLKIAHCFYPKPEASLLGRIHELKSHGDGYYRYLEKIKSKFDREQDPETYTFVEAIIDPLLKEIKVIQSHLNSNQATQQAKAFKKYGEWIERARVWVQFHANVHHKGEIIDAVVRHLIGEALTRIDRDIQVIKDYQLHQLSSLVISTEERYLLAAELKKQVHSYLDQLQTLKQRPAVISLDGLGLWKRQIDEYRQIYFEKALHVIDTLLEREAPMRYSTEVNEHLYDAIHETTYLEKEVAELLCEVETGDLSERSQREMVSDYLVILAEEVHQLTLDLRLGYDLINRLNKVAINIEKAQALLAQKYL